MITFEQFILLFNNLSKLFYHELNGTAQKQRIHCSSYTDHEFDVVTYLNNSIKRSDIKEKYLIPANTDMNVILFVVDKVEFSKLYYEYCIERSIFENGTSSLIIVITTSIKENDASVLHYLYSGIIRAIMNFVFTINDKFIRNPNNHEFENASNVFSELLASTIVDYTNREDYDPIVKHLLEFAKSNCDYIQLLPDQELMNYIDSILI